MKMSADYTPLEFIQSMFPREPSQDNQSITRLIPIEAFNKMELCLRPMMRAAGLRAIYRGKRVSNYCSGVPSMTCREDATGVLIYQK
jgi:hypothetical protein